MVAARPVHNERPLRGTAGAREKLAEPAGRGGAGRRPLVPAAPDLNRRRSDRGRLQRLYAGLPASFGGALSPSDVATAYAGADVLLPPSQTDTIGLVLPEALSCGLPVVAVDTPATRNAIQGNTAVRLVPPGAAPEAWLTQLLAVF